MRNQNRNASPQQVAKQHQQIRHQTNASQYHTSVDVSDMLTIGIDVNDSMNAQRLGGGVAEMNRQDSLRSPMQTSKQSKSTTSRVLNTLNAIGNSQTVSAINHAGDWLTQQSWRSPIAWLESTGQKLAPYQGKYAQRSVEYLNKSVEASNVAWKYSMNTIKEVGEGWQLSNSNRAHILSDNYIKQADLDRIYSKGATVIKWVGKAAGYYALKEAYVDVTLAPSSEKGWTILRQPGGVLVGRLAGALNLGLTVPTDVIPGAFALNIATSVVVASSVENIWKAGVDKMHQKFSDNSDEWYVKKFSK